MTYAQILLSHSRLTFFIPIRWIKDINLTGNHHLNKAKEYICFYSNNPTTAPDFNMPLSKKFNHCEDRLYKAHVVKIFGRGILSSSDDDSEDSGVHLPYSFNRLLKHQNSNGHNGHQSEILKSEQQLIRAIEQAHEDSTELRENAIKTITNILIPRFLPLLIEDHKNQILEIIRKGIKYGGSDNEEILAAQLIPVLMMQQVNGGTEIGISMAPILLATAQNKSKPCMIRAKFCSVLGLIKFLSGDDVGDLLTLMLQLEAIFCEGYQPKEGQHFTRLFCAEQDALHCAALSAWGLLLTMIPSDNFCFMYSNNRAFAPSIRDLMGMLQSRNFDVRMIAGEVIALMLECGRAHDEDFLSDYIPELITITKQLARDSGRNRGRHERKSERNIFRQFLQYLEEDIVTKTKVRFGGENLVLDTWAIKHQYAALHGVLGSQTNTHLMINEYLRDLFKINENVEPLGMSFNIQRSTPPTAAEEEYIPHRHMHNVINADNCREHSMHHNLNSDKRTAVF